MQAMRNWNSNRAGRILGALALITTATAGGNAQSPRFLDPGGRGITPPLDTIAQIRFVTTPDFPPLNMIGTGGRPEGFNVEIARAVCSELGILDRCAIQVLPFDEASAAVAEGNAEAIIAGMTIDEGNRERFAFSRPYLPLPGGFVTRRSDSGDAIPDWSTKRIGVMAGSAHERLLRDYFPKAKVVTYGRMDWIVEDLNSGKIDALFGDGMREALWLSSADGQKCCHFTDGPYFAPEYLGFGLAIAVNRSRGDIASAVDYALGEMEANGVTAEIFRHHFPVSFF
jgi:polar amino acid transport system substrate-binding protein